MSESRKNWFGEAVEKAFVLGRRTITYDHPDTGEHIEAGQGAEVWLRSDEAASMRAKGLVGNEGDPETFIVNTGPGPSVRNDETMGTVKQVGH